jgi:1-acyl-sn-glycerol-3-phosphate acyltransferase
MLMTELERPKVTLQNYQAVYRYYGSDEHAHRYTGKHRRISRAAHYLLNRLYDARLSYGPRAQAATAALAEKGTPALVLINHISQQDPNIAQAALQKDPGFQAVTGRNGLWTATKDGLFRVPFARAYFDSRNLIPVFRPKNYQADEDRRLLFKAAEGLQTVLATQLQRGNSVVLFPEGECNQGDPKKVQKIGDIAARVALKATDLGVENLGLACVGIYRGPVNRTRHASVHLDYYGLNELSLPAEDGRLNSPIARRELRTFMQTSLQQAVDGAVDNY